MIQKIGCLTLILTLASVSNAMHQDASLVLSDNKATSDFVSQIKDLQHKSFIYRMIYHEGFADLRTTINNEYESCYWDYIIQHAPDKKEAVLKFRLHLLSINEGEDIFDYEKRLDEYLKSIIGITLGIEAPRLRRTTLILQQISILKAYMYLFVDQNLVKQFNEQIQQYPWLSTLKLPYEIPTVQKLHLHL